MPFSQHRVPYSDPLREGQIGPERMTYFLLAMPVVKRAITTAEIRVAEIEERSCQIKYVDKRGGRLALAVRNMVNFAETAIETVVEVATGSVAGVVTGAEDVKDSVIRGRRMMPVGTPAAWKYAAGRRAVAEMPPMKPSQSLA